MLNRKRKPANSGITTAVIWLLLFFPLLAIGPEAAQAANDQDAAVRTYRVPNHGRLELMIPPGWHEKVEQPSDDAPPIIMFQPLRSDEFKFLITPMWKENPRVDLDDPAQLRTMVEEMGAQLMQRTAVETRLEVKEIKGDAAIGYYFLLTDKAPKPGEYEYVIGGAVSVGELLLSVTVLLHNKESPARQMALDVLKHARHLK